MLIGCWGPNKAGKKKTLYVTFFLFAFSNGAHKLIISL